MEQDFRQHLDEQLQFLTASAEAYDQGREHEAKRLAVTIRILVRNTRNQTSLLRHLGVQEEVGFVDWGPPVPPHGVHILQFGVTIVRINLSPSGEVSYRPAFRTLDPIRMHPPVSFLDWWERPILTDQHQNSFSRSDLVLSLADKDGGAHIDAAVNDKYRQLTRENSLGFTQGADQRAISNSLVQASVRHIAEELRNTINRNLVLTQHGAAVTQPVCPLPLDSGASAGRNDLCACGSGRKSKRCFAARQPLNVMPAPPDGSSSAPMPPVSLGPRVEAAEALSAPAGETGDYLDLDCLILVPVRG